MFEHPYTQTAGRDLNEHQRDLIHASMPVNEYAWSSPFADSRHQQTRSYYLSNDQDSEYLALYGASELFGQLAGMEPR